MKNEKKKGNLRSDAEGTRNPNQPAHVKNQNDDHNTRKVSLGPNTNR